MKIKQSEQELAYLEKREREVGLRWWAGFCLWSCMRRLLVPGRPSTYMPVSAARTSSNASQRVLG